MHAIFHCVYTPHLKSIICWRALGLFPYFGSSVLLWTLGCNLLKLVFIFPGIFAEVGWLDHMLMLFLVLRNFHTVFHSCYTTLYSHQQYRKVPFFPLGESSLNFVSHRRCTPSSSIQSATTFIPPANQWGRLVGQITLVLVTENTPERLKCKLTHALTEEHTRHSGGAAGLKNESKCVRSRAKGQARQKVRLVLSQ